MNDAQFAEIKRVIEDPAITDMHMNLKTWGEFNRIYWPGHAKVPPGRVRVWIASKKLQGRKYLETVPDGLCQAGTPNTGYRIR